MARLARVVVPGMPHHITQRGNRRQQCFSPTAITEQASPLLELAPDWRSLLTSAVDEETLRDLRCRENTGRSLGDDEFLNRLEKNLGRVLRRQKPGLKGSN